TLNMRPTRHGESMATLLKRIGRGIGTFVCNFATRRRRWLPTVILAFVGICLTLYAPHRLIALFAEEPVSEKDLSIVAPETCLTPKDISLTIFIRNSGNVHASFFPFYGDDVDADRPDKRSCLAIGAREPIEIPPGLSEVWRDEALSKPPVIAHFSHDSADTWMTVVFFPPPIKPDANGWRRIPHNKSMDVVYTAGLSRPTFTMGTLNMTVVVTPFRSIKVVDVYIEDNWEFLTLESIGNK